ncbi:MAG: hypothetical protein UV19_C0006G0020 [Parcubacteria group bacterium GW2011_GWA2_42_28]|nr:MAG: hypothetical protein UV19_C0006G0020 [Parcubacteria group bacterium GW2011_GWA2_42_28]KKT54715.1 MAG: hypothetical protein UW45_C0012G0020 [Parcubacteria group bacterium GW2011_GWC2_44_22]
MYRYLAKTLESGVPVRQALEFYLSEAVGNRRHPELTKALFLLKKRRDLAASLWSAGVIPRVEYLVLEHGTLHNAPDHKLLHSLAHNLSQQSIIKKKIRTLFIYPIILAIELMVILGITLFWLVPQMQFFFYRLHLDVPVLLQVLIGTHRLIKSVLIIDHWPWLILIVLIIWFIREFILLPKVKSRFDYWWLNLPRFGHLYRLMCLQEIFNFIQLQGEINPKNFPAVLKAGAGVTNNLAYRAGLQQLALYLEQGGDLKTFWKNKKNRRLFPVLVYQFLLMGFRSGVLSGEIKALNQLLAEELELELKQFMAVLEPAMIITVAAFVMGFALMLQKVISQLQRASFGG